MTQINLASDLALPIDAITQTFAILGKRGRGKTNTAVVLAEELIRSGLPVVIVDTVGAWWGLRSSADGKKPGLPVVVFGGDHGDIPLEEAAGKLIADVILEHRISAVIDTSALSKAGARRFLTAFVTQVYHRNRDPLHVIFDEADELAPQRPGAEGIKLLGAMEDFVRRGRLRGLGCTLVTQRPAVLHKDVLTQAEVLISMGMTGPRDVAAINEWVQLHADDGEAKIVRDSLASLPVGTGWVWSPEWLGILQRVDFRPRTTFDSSATPKVGQTRIVPVKRAQIDLAALGEQITAMAEKSKADDPAALRRRITELEQEVAHRPATAAPAIEVPTLTPEDLGAIRALTLSLETAAAGISDAVNEAVTFLDDRLARVAPPELAPDRPARAALPAPRVIDKTVPADAGGETSLGKAERKVLTVLATYGERTHVQVAMLTTYSSTSGGFRNTLGKLRSAGLIEGGKDGMHITTAGSLALGAYEALPTGKGLIDHWMTQLSQSQRAILNTLLDAYPEPLTHDQVASETGYQATSGGFRNSLGKLRTLELIHGGRDAIYANETLGEAQ